MRILGVFMIKNSSEQIEYGVHGQVILGASCDIKMASNSVFNKLKKKELTDDERTEMKEKFADVSISSVLNSIRFDKHTKMHNTKRKPY